MALYMAVRVGSLFVAWLPPRLRRAVAVLTGMAAYAVAAEPRRHMQDNLAIALDLRQSDISLRLTALRAFENNAMNWTDTLRLRTLTSTEILDVVRVEGWEHLEDALELGHGVILVGLHLGNVDLVGQILVAHGKRMTVPVEVMRPLPLFHLVQSLRQRHGLTTVPVSGASRSLLRALKRGEVVGLLCDRNVQQNGIRANLFGKFVTVPRGPAWLASRAGAPVLMGWGLRNTDGSFSAKIVPVNLPRTGSQERDIAVNTQSIIDTAEGLIRQHLEQWAMFAPLPIDRGVHGNATVLVH